MKLLFLLVLPLCINAQTKVDTLLMRAERCIISAHNSLVALNTKMDRTSWELQNSAFIDMEKAIDLIRQARNIKHTYYEKDTPSIKDYRLPWTWPKPQ